MKKILAACFALLALAGAALAETAASIPTKIPTPWGSSAGSAYLTNPIPVPSQIGIVNCRASFTDGFPPLTFVPSGAGGCPPFGADMNGILSIITRWTSWYNAGGPVPYDSAFQAAISPAGYPNGAIVGDSSNPGAGWRSTTDNNTTNPTSGGAGWTSIAPQPSISGLKIVNNVGSPTTKADISGDQATILSANNQWVNRKTIAVTINFAVNGANGLDTGSFAAATTYFLYLIDNGTTTAGLASISATSPTLPSGYIYSLRIGAWNTATGSATLLSWLTIGNRTVAIQSLAGQTGYTSTAVTGSCAAQTYTNTGFTGLPSTATFAIGYVLQNTVNTSVGVGRSPSGGTVAQLNTPGSAGNFGYFETAIIVPQNIAICNQNASNAIVANGWIDKVPAF